MYPEEYTSILYVLISSEARSTASFILFLIRLIIQAGTKNQTELKAAQGLTLLNNRITTEKISYKPNFNFAMAEFEVLKKYTKTEIDAMTLLLSLGSANKAVSNHPTFGNYLHCLEYYFLQKFNREQSDNFFEFLSDELLITIFSYVDYVTFSKLIFVCKRFNMLSKDVTLKNRINLFRDLSDEIVLKIFSYLDKKSLIQVADVCKRFKRISEDGSLLSVPKIKSKKRMAAIPTSRSLIEEIFFAFSKSIELGLFPVFKQLIELDKLSQQHVDSFKKLLSDALQRKSYGQLFGMSSINTASIFKGQMLEDNRQRVLTNICFMSVYV